MWVFLSHLITKKTMTIPIISHRGMLSFLVFTANILRAILLQNITNIIETYLLHRNRMWRHSIALCRYLGITSAFASHWAATCIQQMAQVVVKWIFNNYSIIMKLLNSVIKLIYRQPYEEELTLIRSFHAYH